MKPKNKNNDLTKNNNLRKFDCDCVNYVFNKSGHLVCSKCGKPMKSEKKPLTAKGLRYQQGYYD